MSVTVGQYGLRPFNLPVPGPNAVDANEVRGNDNLMRLAFNGHDENAALHMQSGPILSIPASAPDGATWFATDTRDTYTRIGGVWVQTGWAHWYVRAFCDTGQGLVAPNTPQDVILNGVGVIHGFSLASSVLTADYAGTYLLSYQLQIQNASTTNEHNVFAWWTRNGLPVVGSTGAVTVPRQHAGGAGKIVSHFSLLTTLAAGDSLVLRWQATGTSVSLLALPTSGGVPASPSAAVHITRA